MRKTTAPISIILFWIYFIIPAQSQVFLEDFDGSNMTATTSVDMICGVGHPSDYFGITDLTVATTVSYNGASGMFLGAQDTDGNQCNLTKGDFPNATISGIDIMGEVGLIVCFDIAESDASDIEEDWDGNSSVVVSAAVDGVAPVPLFTIEAAGGTNTAPGFDCDGDGLADGASVTESFTTFCTPLAMTGSVMEITIAIANLEAGDEDVAIDNIAVYSDAIPAPNMNTGCTPLMPVCSIINVTLVEEGACADSDVTYSVCADVSGGSGDYNLIDLDNADAVISSLTGQADGNICFDVTMTGPTTASTINLSIADSNDPTCEGESVTISIPACPMTTCEAMIIKFPANGN